MRVSAAVLLLAALPSCLPAQSGSAAALFTTVRSALQAHRPDRDIATLVDGAHLIEKLDIAVVEELQSEGAGPETLDALDRAQELSRNLPKPAAALPLFDAPPPPTSEEQAKTIDQARTLALEYTGTLPNFLCTETVRRYAAGKNAGVWKRRDVLTIALAFTDKGEQYKLLTIDGHPTNKKLADVGGTMSNGEFGSLLKVIFTPKYAATFEWERWTRLGGRLTAVFTYDIEQKNSPYTINWNTHTKHYSGKFALRGAVYIDRETNHVMRFTDNALDIPANWPILATPSTLDYDYADVGGRAYLLPKHVDSRVLMKSEQTRNRIEFGDYRKFSSEATVTFDK
jgi:hypothetical protein